MQIDFLTLFPEIALAPLKSVFSRIADEAKSGSLASTFADLTSSVTEYQ